MYIVNVDLYECLSCKLSLREPSPLLFCIQEGDGFDTFWFSGEWNASCVINTARWAVNGSQVP